MLDCILDSVELEEKIDFLKYYSYVCNKKYKKKIGNECIFLFEINGKLLIYFRNNYNSYLFSKIANYYIFKWKNSLYLDECANYIVYVFIDSKIINQEIKDILCHPSIVNKRGLFDNKFSYRNILYFQNKLIFGSIKDLGGRRDYYSAFIKYYINDVIYNIKISKFKNYYLTFNKFSKFTYISRYSTISKYILYGDCLRVIVLIVVSFVSIFLYIFIKSYIILIPYLIFIYVFFNIYNFEEFNSNCLKNIYLEYNYQFFCNVLKKILFKKKYNIIEKNIFKYCRLYVVFKDNNMKIKDEYEYIIIYKDKNHKLLNKDNVTEIQFIEGDNKLVIVNKSKNKKVLNEFMKLMKCYYDNIS